MSRFVFVLTPVHALHAAADKKNLSIIYSRGALLYHKFTTSRLKNETVRRYFVQNDFNVHYDCQYTV